jgi:hypothetical protein
VESVEMRERASYKEVHVTKWQMKSQQEMLLQELIVTCGLTALCEIFWNDHMPIDEGSAIVVFKRTQGKLVLFNRYERESRVLGLS